MAADTEIQTKKPLSRIDNYTDPRTEKKALTNFIAGAVGGAGSASLSHPLDTVKVKLQTFPGLYRGGVHCVREVFRQDGIKGFYRGLTPGVTLSMTEASIRYMTYGLCQDIVRKLILKVERSSEKMTLVQNALAGGLTGFFSTFASCPIELIKCRVQGMLEITAGSQSSNGSTGAAQSNVRSTANSVSGATEKVTARRGPAAVIGHVLRTEGVRGLYRGLTSNLARNTPGELVFFATYEQCRYLARRPGQVKDDIGALGSFLCGSCAGTAYWRSIYPLDSVKSRVQVLSTQGKESGLVKVFIHILKTDGMRGLYNGVWYSIPRAMIGSGSHFVFYETTRKLLLGHRTS